MALAPGKTEALAVAVVHRVEQMVAERMVEPARLAV